MAAFVRPVTQPYTHSSVYVQPNSPFLRADYPSSEDPLTIVTLELENGWDSIHPDSPIRQVVTDQDVVDGDKIEFDTRATSGDLVKVETDGRMGIENAGSDNR